MAVVEEFVYSLVTLFVIMDPFMSLPPLLSITKNFSEEKRRVAANKAIVVAGVLALAFLLAGPLLLQYLGITLSSFMIAGGIVLGLLGLQMVLHFSLSQPEKDAGAAVVLIATPLLTGPGLLTTLVILNGQHGFAVTVAALVVALAAAWIVLSNASRIKSFIGDQVIEIVSRVMGLMLVAIAVTFIQKGLAG